MAHVPERPQLYVCPECQIVHAGTVTDHSGTSHHYIEPEECRGCGSTDFVALTRWVEPEASGLFL